MHNNNNIDGRPTLSGQHMFHESAKLPYMIGDNHKLKTGNTDTEQRYEP
jgi:hypothetical protein